MSNTLKAHLSLFLAQVIYALNYSIAKGLMPQNIQPLGLVLLRVSGGCLLFWLTSFFIKQEKIPNADIRKMILLAVFGVAINQAFFIYGLSLTKPINSAIIMISNPIVVMLFTLLALKEKITLQKVSGLFLGITGALILLLFRGNFEYGSDTITGDLFTLINSFSWAVFLVLAKPFIIKYHTVHVMKWTFFFGLFMIFPFGIGDLCAVDWLGLSSSVIFALIFVVVATTFLAYLINTYALKELSPSVTSTYIYYQPFLASFFAIIMGKDSISLIKIISALFIISGVYLVSRNSKKVMKNV